MGNMERIEIGGEYSGKRIDKAIVEILKGLDIYIPSRSFFKKFLVKGIIVNGRTVKGSYKLKEGDVVEIDTSLLEEEISEIDISGKVSPQNMDLDIVYENDQYMVVNKPKRIAVHPGVGNKDGTLSNYIRGYLESKGEYDPLVERGGIVHRLDRGVSGLIVVAKNSESQRFLKKQFQDRKVKKIYKAKTVKFKESELDSLQISKIRFQGDDIETGKEWLKVEGYIGRSRTNRFRMVFKKYDFNGSKPSVSHFCKIGEEEYLVKIDTGRMHQIRATLFYLGRTINGDTLYSPGSRKFTPDAIDLESVFISFLDPSGEKKIFTTLEK